MSKKPLHIVVLAAGQGTRMKSWLPKVLHPVAGRPMLQHVLDTAQALGADACHVVVGHGADAVRQAVVPPAGMRPRWVLQSEQRGTAHAVIQAMPEVPDEARVLVMYGDVPLVSDAVLRPLLEGADGALLGAEVDDPTGYGRLLRDGDGRLAAIVEHKDATAEQRSLREINTGFLSVPAARLRGWLERVGNDNAGGEYYLTDIVGFAATEGVPLEIVLADDPLAVEGVNDRAQLARAERVMQHRQAQRLMADGVHICDPARFDLRGTLQAGADVFIDVGVVIEGDVALGDGVHVGPYTVLRDSRIGNGTRIASHCVLDRASVGADCTIGPYARLRPGTDCADNAHVGNFVEIKNARLGAGSKANHLSYVGDSVVGDGVNIGAGTITCNYDGANKHRTEIGDGAFIGSNTSLVAPVKIGAGATIGAGSVITRDAPDDALTLARAREQKSYKGWKRPTKQ